MINGNNLPVSEFGIPARRLTRFPNLWAPNLWAPKASKLLTDEDCAGLLIRWSDDLSAKFKKSADELGFTSRVSFTGTP